jgi:hypothetical protein
MDKEVLSVNKKILLAGGIAVISATMILLAIRIVLHGWSVDFSNTAWGVIAGALISSVVGIVLKYTMDVRLATLQGDMQQKLQVGLDTERARFQEHLTAIKATLDDRNSAAAARRDYEYEARKRLYNEVEPLLFQIYEALEEAHHRVRSLARTARNGELGWLERDGYYLTSTVYKLLLPVVHLRLLQQRMTFVDLGLDPHIELRYLLLKLHARSFTDDFIFAQISPRISYDPNHVEWRQRREKDPAVYARQALVLGDLECVVELLINREGETSRALSYGEFEGLLSKRPIDENLQEAIDLFRGFSPQRKPVLARMLVAQGCLSKFIVSTYHAGDVTNSLTERYGRAVDDAVVKELAWSADSEGGVGLAADYWKKKLELLESEITARRHAMGAPAS